MYGFGYTTLISSMSKGVSILPIITDGLVLNLDAGNSASYPGTGTVWTDLSGNGNNGTLINGTSYSSANGGTMVFDGINDYVKVNNITNTLLGNNYTLSLWFNTGSSSDFGIFQIAFDVNYSVPYLLFQKNSTNTRWLISGAYRFTTAITNNTWYNVTLTYDGTSVKTYMNGNLYGTYAGVVTGGNAGDKLFIGNGFPTYYNGNIPAFHAYNRALTASEINTNFNATKTRFGL